MDSEEDNVDDGHGQLAKDVERVLGGTDDRPDVLEWVADAVQRSMKTFSFTIPNEYSPRILNYVDANELSRNLRNAAQTKRDLHKANGGG